MAPLGEATRSCVYGVLESSDDLAAAVTAVVVVSAIAIAAVVSAVTAIIVAVVTTTAVVVAIVMSSVAVVVTVAVAVAMSSVAAAVRAHPNFFLNPVVVSGDPNLACPTVAVAASFIVAGNPSFGAHPFPVSVVVSSMSTVVVPYTYVGIEVVIGENRSNDETADKASDDGLLLVAGSGGVWGYECCDYG